MRPPLTRQGQLRLWAILSILFGLGLLAWAVNPANGIELRWQQPDGEAPISHWRVKRFGTLTPVATILRTVIPEQTVTPGPWFPTPGPGAPARTIRQYATDVPNLQPGWLIYLQAQDDRGLVSSESNLKALPSNTPSPAATLTATVPKTVTGTRTATPERPHAPFQLP